MHTCDALVVCCIDFRFQKFIRDFTNRELAGKSFDLVGFAGSTKELETILKQLEISVKLHDIKQVFFIHHEECGAYGVQSTPQNHRRDLLKAKEIILEKYSKLEVLTYYVHLDGNFEKVV